MNTINIIIEKVRKRFTEKEFKHALGVARTAEKLAISEGVSSKKAFLAGIIHDFAKGMNKKKLRQIINDSDWKIDNLEYSLPEVLHAPAGASLVKEEFGIYDKTVLAAIRFHTIGSPEMGDLSKIIFVADIIEPNRSFSEIDEIRKRVKEKLNLGVIAACTQSLIYNIEKNRLIHPNTLNLRNKLLKEEDYGEEVEK